MLKDKSAARPERRPGRSAARRSPTPVEQLVELLVAFPDAVLHAPGEDGIALGERAD